MEMTAEGPKLLWPPPQEDKTFGIHIAPASTTSSSHNPSLAPTTRGDGEDPDPDDEDAEKAARHASPLGRRYPGVDERVFDAAEASI
ncbi:hypothetical protein LTR53_020280, partial [Teratosphaeriaceae sp. CCFEE 6253]